MSKALRAAGSGRSACACIVSGVLHRRQTRLEEPSERIRSSLVRMSNHLDLSEKGLRRHARCRSP